METKEAFLRVEITLQAYYNPKLPLILATDMSNSIPFIPE